MALTRKPGSRDPGPLDLPALTPRLPDDAKARFPSLVKWETELQEFWDSVRANLRARDAELERRLTAAEEQE